jgi:poly(hydroxyalkanoate) depolymerase family esterase
MRIRTLLLTALAAVSTTSASAGAQPAASAPAERWEWHQYSGPEGTRRYRLFVGNGAVPAGGAPLVVMLHGCTQDPDDFARGTRFNALAGAAGVVVAWPEQPATQHPQKCWTWYDPAHQGAAHGEPALIAAITREVAAAEKADPHRIYLAGVSAGAAMAVNTAAAYPRLYAAVASHSGIPYRAASDAGHAWAVMHAGSSDPAILAYALQDALGGAVVPLLAIHGGADAVVLPVNSRQLAGQWAGVLHATASAPEHSEAGGLAVERTRWSAAGRTVIELVVVEGLGHAWSGGSTEGTFTDARGPDASRLVLDFLLAQAR